jgi:phage replication O-like protein O
LANVQIDNGDFTRIANEILEHIAKAKLNGTQYAIVLMIWRYTYGFQRKEHEFSQGYLARETGLDRHQIQRELTKLIDRQIITVVKPPTKSTPQVLRFNKDYEKWKVLAKSLTGSENANTSISENANTSISEKANTSISEKANTPVSELANQIKKDNKKRIKESTPFIIPPKQISPKKTYGEYRHVKLTDEELARLYNDYGRQETDQAIIFFDAYIEEKGYKSKSHNLAMRRWVFDAVKKNQAKPPPIPRAYQSLQEWSEGE